MQSEFASNFDKWLLLFCDAEPVDYMLNTDGCVYVVGVGSWGSLTETPTRTATPNSTTPSSTCWRGATRTSTRTRRWGLGDINNNE